MLLVTLCFAPLLTGMSSARRFESGPRSNPTASRVTFSERVSSTREFNSYVYDELEGRWSGDGMSRLVLYTWRENSGGVAVNSLHENDLDDSGWIFEYTDEKYYFDDGEVSGAEGWLEDDYAADESEWDAAFAEASTVQPMSSPGTPVYLAYDIPWVTDIFRRLGDKDRVVRVPRPCIRRNGGEYCGSWQRVRNVDLGRCSIELPYANRGVLTPYILAEAGLRNFSLGDELVNGVLSAIPSRNTGWAKKVFFSDVTFTPLPARSTWHISPENEDICVSAKALIYQRAVRLFGVIPFSKFCHGRSVVFEICGRVELGAPGEILWNTSSTDFYEETTDFCAKMVTKRVNENLDEMLGDPYNNPITETLRQYLQESFSVSGEKLKRDLPDFAASMISESCSNPTPFPGTPTRACFSDALGFLPGRCVSTFDGAGECRTEVPIVRVETTPAGIDLVLVDHRQAAVGKPDDSWLYQLFSVLSFFELFGSSEELKLGVVSTLRDHQCILGSSGDARDTRAISRFGERLLRGNVSTIAGEHP